MSPFFELDVPQQPIKYLDVAVHRDVDVFDFLALVEVGLEVEHVFFEVVFLAVEVAADLAVFVVDVDDEDFISLRLVCFLIQSLVFTDAV